MSQTDDDLIEVGHILGVHGVKGQVKVFSLTSPRENIVNYNPWLIQHKGQNSPLSIKGGKQGKNVVASLEGVTDREQAQDIVGAKIFIRKSQLPTLSQGDYYWTQLCGLKVISTGGEYFGTIDHMLETGANDVMVVQGERERLIPYIMGEVVKNIDLEKQQVIVDWDAEF